RRAAHAAPWGGGLHQAGERPRPRHRARTPGRAVWRRLGGRESGERRAGSSSRARGSRGKRFGLRLALPGRGDPGAQGLEPARTYRTHRYTLPANIGNISASPNPAHKAPPLMASPVSRMRPRIMPPAPSRRSHLDLVWLTCDGGAVAGAWGMDGLRRAAKA